MAGRSDRLYGWLSAALLAGVALLVALTFDDYGPSVDWVIHLRYGRRVADFLLGGFDPEPIWALKDIRFYGGFFDALAHGLASLLPTSESEARHLAVATAGWIGLLGTQRLGALLGGPGAGFWALALLVATPSYYGHMFMNPKDVPFAAGYVWSLYLLAKTARALPEVPWRDALALGLALGATLGVRVVGAVLLGYGGLLLLLWAGTEWLHGASAAHYRAWARRLAPRGAATLAVAYAGMVALWPLALLDPLGGPLEALSAITDFPARGRVLFLGEAVHSAALPWEYFPVYFAVKLPEVVLACALAGLAWAILRLVRTARAGLAGEERALAAVCLGLLVPPVWAIAAGTVHYDGLRHMLFLLPPATALGGVAVAAAGRSLARSRLRPALPRALRAGLLLLVVLGLASSAWRMARLHPYEYVFYNAFVGGVAGAQGRFELDYWATSFREAARRLRGRVRRAGLAAPVRVAVCGPIRLARAFLPGPSFQVVSSRSAGKADFTLQVVRPPCGWGMRAPLLFAVRRDGAALSVVGDLRAR